MKLVWMIVTAMCAMMVPMVAQAQMVIVMRHAERADGGVAPPSMAGSSDPELSVVGKARAQKLAAMLGDAGVVAIYTTQYRRTKDTAAPLAAKIGVVREIMPSAQSMSALVAKIKAHKTGAVLVVGHSNTVPQIVKALGGSVVTVGDDEYDSLFFVAANGTTTRIRFKP